MTDVRPAPRALPATAGQQLESLCSVVPDRRPGSTGNDEATAFVAKVLRHAGWDLALQRFDCLDWSGEESVLTVDGSTIPATPSPYGLGVTGLGPLRVLSDPDDLMRDDLRGAIIVLTGALSAEPLAPKNHPFYRAPEHARFVRRLEDVAPLAVVGVTGRSPQVCGAVEPFPLIEDGDVTIPVANVLPAEAAPLLAADGRQATVEIRARRRLASACNVTALREPSTRRVTVIAHVDSKPGTPGAVDNASGVVVGLLLAELLAPGRYPRLPVGVELLFVNGEDHYAAPGEIAWLAEHGEALDAIELVVNVDGVGYPGGSGYSTYNLSQEMADQIAEVFGAHDDLAPGAEWYQSDHAIFALQGRPAVAITAERLDEMLATVCHSPADTPERVDVDGLVSIATALETLVVTWPTP